ncbi:Kazal-type serine protease inhibitor domain-containing protein [Toxoplasma gondii VAND]|uniref:Kazal-type serine protease inhibitor domain-containing protein n=1 Tax=Toxoplasma gondii VAND TaxID=933077 RepID=A0A086QLS7_TOXGO|nr:Kazal-type serine protease inhibitor domain-containing protein [Toxoplasma gondii VAND]
MRQKSQNCEDVQESSSSHSSGSLFSSSQICRRPYDSRPKSFRLLRHKMSIFAFVRARRFLSLGFLLFCRTVFLTPTSSPSLPFFPVSAQGVYPPESGGFPSLSPLQQLQILQQQRALPLGSFGVSPSMPPGGTQQPQLQVPSLPSYPNSPNVSSFPYSLPPRYAGGGMMPYSPHSSPPVYNHPASGPPETASSQVYVQQVPSSPSRAPQYSPPPELSRQSQGGYSQLRNPPSQLSSNGFLPSSVSSAQPNGSSVPRGSASADSRGTMRLSGVSENADTLSTLSPQEQQELLRLLGGGRGEVSGGSFGILEGSGFAQTPSPISSPGVYVHPSRPPPSADSPMYNHSHQQTGLSQFEYGQAGWGLSRGGPPQNPQQAYEMLQRNYLQAAETSAPDISRLPASSPLPALHQQLLRSPSFASPTHSPPSASPPPAASAFSPPFPPSSSHPSAASFSPSSPFPASSSGHAPAYQSAPPTQRPAGGPAFSGQSAGEAPPLASPQRSFSLPPAFSSVLRVLLDDLARGRTDTVEEVAGILLQHLPEQQRHQVFAILTKALAAAKAKSDAPRSSSQLAETLSGFSSVSTLQEAGQGVAGRDRAGEGAPFSYSAPRPYPAFPPPASNAAYNSSSWPYGFSSLSMKCVHLCTPETEKETRDGPYLGQVLCGSDGLVYPTVCDYERARCMHPQLEVISLSKDGRDCPPPPPPFLPPPPSLRSPSSSSPSSSSPSSSSPSSSSPPFSQDSLRQCLSLPVCQVQESGSSASATRAFSFSPETLLQADQHWEPQCASDGNTYANPCVFAVEACVRRVTGQDPLFKIHEGVCGQQLSPTSSTASSAPSSSSFSSFSSLSPSWSSSSASAVSPLSSSSSLADKKAGSLVERRENDEASGDGRERPGDASDEARLEGYEGRERPGESGNEGRGKRPEQTKDSASRGENKEKQARRSNDNTDSLPEEDPNSAFSSTASLFAASAHAASLDEESETLGGDSKKKDVHKAATEPSEGGASRMQSGRLIPIREKPSLSGSQSDKKTFPFVLHNKASASDRKNHVGVQTPSSTSAAPPSLPSSSTTTTSAPSSHSPSSLPDSPPSTNFSAPFSPSSPPSRSAMSSVSTVEAEAVLSSQRGRHPTEATEEKRGESREAKQETTQRESVGEALVGRVSALLRGESLPGQGAAREAAVEEATRLAAVRGKEGGDWEQGDEPTQREDEQAEKKIVKLRNEMHTDAQKASMQQLMQKREAVQNLQNMQNLQLELQQQQPPSQFDAKSFLTSLHGVTSVQELMEERTRQKLEELQRADSQREQTKNRADTVKGHYSPVLAFVEGPHGFAPRPQQDAEGSRPLPTSDRVSSSPFVVFQNPGGAGVYEQTPGGAAGGLGGSQRSGHTAPQLEGQNVSPYSLSQLSPISSSFVPSLSYPTSALPQLYPPSSPNPASRHGVSSDGPPVAPSSLYSLSVSRPGDPSPGPLSPSSSSSPSLPPNALSLHSETSRSNFSSSSSVPAPASPSSSPSLSIYSPVSASPASPSSSSASSSRSVSSSSSQSSLPSPSQCNFLCPPGGPVVCGTDGQTYENECEVRVYACLQRTATLKVKHRGACKKQSGQLEEETKRGKENTEKKDDARLGVDGQDSHGGRLRDGGKDGWSNDTPKAKTYTPKPGRDTPEVGRDTPRSSVSWRSSSTQAQPSKSVFLDGTSRAEDLVAEDMSLGMQTGRVERGGTVPSLASSASSSRNGGLQERLRDATSSQNEEGASLLGGKEDRDRWDFSLALDGITQTLSADPASSANSRVFSPFAFREGREERGRRDPPFSASLSSSPSASDAFSLGAKSRETPDREGQEQAERGKKETPMLDEASGVAGRDGRREAGDEAENEERGKRRERPSWESRFSSPQRLETSSLRTDIKHDSGPEARARDKAFLEPSLPRQNGARAVTGAREGEKSAATGSYQAGKRAEDSQTSTTHFLSSSAGQAKTTNGEETDRGYRKTDEEPGDKELDYLDDLARLKAMIDWDSFDDDDAKEEKEQEDGIIDDAPYIYIEGQETGKGETLP